MAKPTLGSFVHLEGIASLAAWRSSLAPGKRLGFVPTMGALHAGHAEVIRAAVQNCDAVLVSVFVNPLQFDERSDFEAYPRNPKKDCRLVEEWGAHAVWLPSEEDVYPEQHVSQLAAGLAGDGFEGAARPGHFDGMLTVVRRLFETVQPTDTFFGEKDAQQLHLVRELAQAMPDGPLVHGVSTVREEDGLAMSSRNARLTPEQRSQAAQVFLTLLGAKDSFQAGERNQSTLEEGMRTKLESAGFRVDYACLVDDETFLPADAETQSWRAVIAARLGEVRLIDNLLLGDPR